MGLLDGKVVIITGAGGGIGRAHALLLAKEGAKVVVNDIGGNKDGSGAQTSMADTVVAEVTQAGGTAVASYDSVATREGADALLWTAVSRFGRVDVLINNAGIVRDRTLVNMSEAEWDSVQAVHLRGTFLMTQVVARQIKQQGGGGRIINTTSMSGLLGNFGQSNYGAAKAGIAGFTFTAAQELGRWAINVNAIAPIAATRMTQDLQFMQQFDQKSISPECIAPVALYLASERAANITGKIFGVHGTRVFEYRVQQSDGVTLPEGQSWNADSLAKRMGEICA